MNFEEACKIVVEKGYAIMKKPPPVDKVYSIQETAAELGVKYRAVQGYIKKGDLGGMVNIYGKVTIKQSDIDAFRELGTRRRTKKETSREADKVLDRIGDGK